MKVGIDIRVLIKGKRTGVEDYTINLLSHLIPLDKSIKYKLFYNGFKKAKLDFSFLKAPNVKIKETNIPNRILDIFLRFFNFPKLDKLLGGVDVFLSPHFLLAPVEKKTKTVIVFFDLSFIRFPEFFSLKKLIWHKSICPKKQAEKADQIIAISESTKNDLIDLYGIDKRKIKVIYPGISDKFKKIEKKDAISVKEKYNLPDKFILYFATIEPRKNVLGLIRAFEKIKRNDFKKDINVDWKGFEGMVKSKKSFDFSDYKLVIAGSKGWLYDEVFEKEFKKDIIFTDFIEEQDKVYLYNLADIFVYPSFFEGFGLPPLEAMACEVPVVVSNKSSLSEVVGDAGIMINPNNIDEIAFAIKMILQDKELKNYLIDKGLKRVKKFKWEKKAREVLKVLKKPR